jgi:hypothetical protein
MEWEKIIWALLLLAMILLLWPRAKQMMAASQAAERDWPGVLLPILGVIGFVLLLVMLIRS